MQRWDNDDDINGSGSSGGGGGCEIAVTKHHQRTGMKLVMLKPDMINWDKNSTTTKDGGNDTRER
ncbi:hypothetical protein ACHAW5_006194 [Stephanodiscus triporus]|uniref:Uncharacterized protein n=1 Tax=Stephanodiscus triporus TaxID=2934178 RepID=A0ABD3NLY2_9STRA